MDIQIASNFERLLFELYEGDGAALAGDMKRLRAEGRLRLSPERHAALRRGFMARRVSDEETLRSIADAWHRFGLMLDPHTAIGVKAARESGLPSDMPIVALATAHPAKFPDAVVEATGATPRLPPHLADLMQRRERFSALPNDLEQLQRFILERVTL
jgi:threonine synthase